MAPFKRFMSVRALSSPPSSPTSPPKTISDAITSSRNEVIKKHELQALTRKVINTVVPKVAVSRAIELYGMEKPYAEQPGEDMGEVEQILMMKGFNHQTPDYRRMTISKK
jgi:hypothetical protein